MAEIVFRDVSEEALLAVAKVLAQHGADVEINASTGWTSARAESLLRDLPTFQQQIIKNAVHGDGWAPAEKLRDEDGSLRGRSSAIKRAVERGVKDGRFPEGIPVPVIAQYDPEVQGWQRTAGYMLPEEHLTAFRTAVQRIEREDQ
jgi:hypothetical protein